MDLAAVIIAVAVMTGLGLSLASVLAVANRKFYVFEDPRIDQVERMLPGSNCGACGLPVFGVRPSNLYNLPNSSDIELKIVNNRRSDPRPRPALYNKEIAHLTSDRIAGSPPAKAWDFQGLANELRPLLRLLSANALTSRLSPNAAAAIR